ncbi:hypothetical protein JQ615_07470 [Bradyrhizobium jicamae]|uniref:Uncharacterized protein n=1 Tax=Bradyrhizobium jicamae TaxID=280332 RepID=A0ABS5FER9_9BRAD|nr:hypothetical protein [Bradyrhizobium jicamae]MBR0795222.1 hypothetical protein [Bradyrhizobium jicamae]MBR0931793.1 hypothetical protein [Bradyrhizobium jicamae]
MSLPAENTFPDIRDRLRDASSVTAGFMADIISQTCRRFPSPGQGGKTARIERLIESGAWTDAVLALVDLELPQWQVRRLVYDEGEWHCALSRERELPDWLDRAIETRHEDLALAILGAFLEARQLSAPESRTSVPTVPHRDGSLCPPLLVDSFS